MNNQNYTTTITVDQTPDEVFTAINNVRGWWSGEIEGDTETLGSEFIYKYKDMHRSVQKIAELIPGKRVHWHVTEANISFINDKNEWEGTDIIFDIHEKDGKTEVVFTHEGLTPEFECYEACSGGWSSLINDNLRNLIMTGESQPDAF